MIEMLGSCSLVRIPYKWQSQPHSVGRFWFTRWDIIIYDELKAHVHTCALMSLFSCPWSGTWEMQLPSCETLALPGWWTIIVCCCCKSMLWVCCTAKYKATNVIVCGIIRCIVAQSTLNYGMHRQQHFGKLAEGLCGLASLSHVTQLARCEYVD